jgi:sulfate permease, SulP family
MANGDPQRYAQIASLAAFTVAALCLIAWEFRRSAIVKLICGTILVGFNHAENEELPGVIAFRPEASLIYVNVAAVRESVLNRLEAAGRSNIQLLVCDLSTSPYVDLRLAHAAPAAF